MNIFPSGSLVVEKSSARQPSGPQPFPFQQMNPGPRGEGPPLALTGSQAQQHRQSTLAQLQMQVEKLSQQPSRHVSPSHWSWGMRPPGQAPSSRPMQGGSPSQNLTGMPQQAWRYGNPHINTRSPPTLIQNSSIPQQVKVWGSSNTPILLLT